MNKGNIIFLSILGVFVVFLLFMLVQEYTYPRSLMQEMRPIAMGKFIVYRDCYNSPKYYLDANPIPSHQMATKIDKRDESVLLTDLKENYEYRLYVRDGILKSYYFVECVN